MGAAFFRKLTALFQTYVSECFAYPATSVIWILADTVTALILPAVWLAAAGPSGQVAGFSGREMVTYYLVTMTLAQFVTCHLMWDISFDIREGFFSAQIVRPFSFLAHCVARNLAWRVSKLVLFLPIGGLFYLIYLGNSAPSPLQFSGAFFVALILGHTLSFLAAYTLALVALWTVEFQSILEIYYVPEQVLSGRVLPLAALPAWALVGGDFLYFRYTVAFPAEILMGRTTPEFLLRGFATQGIWLLVLLVAAHVTLKAGMRKYTGHGM